MKSASNESGIMLVGLDIGTSKVAAVIASLGDLGEMEIIGFGSAPSGSGMKKGVLVNIDIMAEAIRRAVRQAETMAGCEVRSVLVGVSGQKITSRTTRGTVRVPGGEVDAGDVERVIDTAEAIDLPADHRVLHILPKEFIVDGQGGIDHPIGMTAVRLEVDVQIITCASNMAENIERCIERCGLRCDSMVLEQLASAYAVLEEDERDLGVCMVDIGHGTTDIIVFHSGAVQYAATIPVAGSQVTNDVASALNTTTRLAADIKERFGSALAKLVGADMVVEVPSLGDRPPRQASRQALAAAVESRYEELFDLVKAALVNGGHERCLRSGIVLTGGAAGIHGAVELAEEVFGVQVRLGIPRHLSGLEDLVAKPACATGVGLLCYGAAMRRDGATPETGGANIFSRFQQWLRRHF